MTNPNPFGPAVPTQAPPTAPPAQAPPQQGSPFGQPQQAPPAQPAPYGGWPQPDPRQAPPAAPQQAPQPQAYGTPGQPGSSQWPAGAQAATPPALGAFGTPGPPPPAGSGSGAKIADMYGRLVILFPMMIERGLPSTFKDNNGGPKTQDRITATVVVLDDGRGGQSPIEFGGDMTKFPPVAHTASEPLPYLRKGLHVWQSSIIKQIESWLPGGANAPQDGRTPGMVLGRVAKDGPERTDPWYLRSEVTTQDTVLANYYIQAVAEGRFPHPLAQG